jgi:hypothetical protein
MGLSNPGAGHSRCTPHEWRWSFKHRLLLANGRLGARSPRRQREGLRVHILRWIQLQERPRLVGIPATKPILVIVRSNDNRPLLIKPQCANGWCHRQYSLAPARDTGQPGSSETFGLHRCATTCARRSSLRSWANPQRLAKAPQLRPRYPANFQSPNRRLVQPSLQTESNQDDRAQCYRRRRAACLVPPEVACSATWVSNPPTE